MQSPSLLTASNAIYSAIVDHNLALSQKADRGEITHQQYTVQAFPSCALTLIGNAIQESIAKFEEQQKEIANNQAEHDKKVSMNIETGDPTLGQATMTVHS
jgi:hypothetical protein